MSAAKHTPGPWTWQNTPGAGLEIFGDVSATMGEQFAGVQVNTWGLGACSGRVQIAYERWVQFPKQAWNEMQEANARLIAAAPEMAALLPRLREIVAEEADDTLSLFEGDPEQSEMVAPYDALLREIDAVMAKITGGAA